MTKFIEPLLLLLGSVQINANQVCNGDGRPNWCAKNYNENYNKLRLLCEKPNSKVSTTLCCKTCEKYTDEVEIIKHQYGLPAMFDDQDFIASYTSQTIPDYTELPLEFFNSTTGQTLLNFFQSKTDNLFGTARNAQDWDGVMACRLCSSDGKMLVLNGDKNTIWRGTKRTMGFVEDEANLSYASYCSKNKAMDKPRRLCSFNEQSQAEWYSCSPIDWTQVSEGSYQCPVNQMSFHAIYFQTQKYNYFRDNFGYGQSV